MQQQFEYQQKLNQQQIEGQQSMYAPQLYEHMQQNQAVLVEQTNPKKIVKEIVLRLRGLEEKEDGRVVQVAEPKINKRGYDNVWFILDSHINQNVILSHLNDQEIRKIMENVQDDIVDDLSLNKDNYGIKSKTDLDLINNSIIVNIYLALKRAREQNEKNWLGKIALEHIGGGRPQSKTKGGWTSKFRLN